MNFDVGVPTIFLSGLSIRRLGDWIPIDITPAGILRMHLPLPRLCVESVGESLHRKM